MVQVAAASEYRGIGAFREAILALPFESRLAPTPSIRLRSLRGRALEFTYGKAPVVDGRPLDYASWPLFCGPFLEALVAPESFTLRYKKDTRTLNFRKLIVTNPSNHGFLRERELCATSSQSRVKQTEYLGATVRRLVTEQDFNGRTV